MNLGELSQGMIGQIESLASSPAGMAQRLRELGFLEGERVEVKHEAPVSRDPFTVQVRGGLIALRRQEANLIQVRVIES